MLKCRKIRPRMHSSYDNVHNLHSTHSTTSILNLTYPELPPSHIKSTHKSRRKVNRPAKCFLNTPRTRSKKVQRLVAFWTVHQLTYQLPCSMLAHTNTAWHDITKITKQMNRTRERQLSTGTGMWQQQAAMIPIIDQTTSEFAMLAILYIPTHTRVYGTRSSQTISFVGEGNATKGLPHNTTQIRITHLHVSINTAPDNDLWSGRWDNPQEAIILTTGKAMGSKQQVILVENPNQVCTQIHWKGHSPLGLNHTTKVTNRTKSIEARKANWVHGL